MKVKRLVSLKKNHFEGMGSPFSMTMSMNNAAYPDGNAPLVSQYSYKMQFFNNSNYDMVVKDRLNVPMVFTQNNRGGNMSEIKTAHDRGLIITKTYEFSSSVKQSILEVARQRAHEDSEIGKIFKYMLGDYRFTHSAYNLNTINFCVTYVIGMENFSNDIESVYLPDLDLIVTCFKKTYQPVQTLIENSEDHPKYGEVIYDKSENNLAHRTTVHLVDSNLIIRNIYLRQGSHITKIAAQVDTEFSKNNCDGIYIVKEHNGRTETNFIPLQEHMDEESLAKLRAHGVFIDKNSASGFSEKDRLERDIAEKIHKQEMEKIENKYKEMEQKKNFIEKEKELNEEKHRQEMDKANKQLELNEEKHRLEMEKNQKQLELNEEKHKQEMEKNQKQLELNEEKHKQEMEKIQKELVLSRKNFVYENNTIDRKDRSEVVKSNYDILKVGIAVVSVVAAFSYSVWRFFIDR